MKKTFFIISIIFLFICLLVTYTNTLSFKLRRYTWQKDYRIGIAVLKNDKIWTIGTQKLPLLSVFKYFIAVEVLNKLDKQKIDLNTKLTIKETMINKNLYSPMLKKYKSFPIGITIAELLEYTISESDNNASDILLEYIGGARKLDKVLKDTGFSGIEISVNEKEMNSDINKQYLNQTTPKDVAKYMKTVRETDILTVEHKNFLDKIMEKTVTGEDKIKKGLPPGTVFGHKTGSSSRDENTGLKIADNDAGYVILPNGETYYIAVFISNSKLSDKENAEIIANISKTVYKHIVCRSIYCD